MPDAKERPIQFSGPMVRAILDGRKTQTRRVMKVQLPAGNWRYAGVGDVDKDEDDPGHELHWLEELAEKGRPIERYWCVGKCPFGKVGDRLWVRETFQKWAQGVGFRADDESACGPWTPSSHMPRWACRIILEITDVRVERLQEIRPCDAIREGFGPYCTVQNIDCDSINPVDVYRDYWDTIAKPGGKWQDNPWVWVIGFRRAEND